MSLIGKLKAKQVFNRVVSDVRKIEGVSTFYINNIFESKDTYSTDYNLRCYNYCGNALKECFENCTNKYKVDIKVESEVEDGNESHIKGSLNMKG